MFGSMNGDSIGNIVDRNERDNIVVVERFQKIGDELLSIFKVKSLKEVLSIERSNIVDHVDSGRQPNRSKNGVTADTLIRDCHQRGHLVVCIHEQCSCLTFLIVRQEYPTRCSLVLGYFVGLRLKLTLLDVGFPREQSSHTWVC